MILNIIRVLVLLLLTIEVHADKKFLGVFTTDNYPVENCTIIKAHNHLLVSESYGTYSQSVTKKRKYTDEINQEERRINLIKMARDEGYNAIIGYKYYVVGGYDGFNGSTINGSLGIGVYRAGVMGNAVLVSCK